MFIEGSSYDMTLLEQYVNEICGTLDCSECPFFYRFDVCRPEDCTHLYEEV